MRTWLILLSALSGLLGAAGVSLAAVGAHVSGDPTVTTAANFLLFHAAALVGLCTAATMSRGWALLGSASLIALGVILFSGDLAMRALAHITLVHMAAPTGGILLIIGWLTAALALPAMVRQQAR